MVPPYAVEWDRKRMETQLIRTLTSAPHTTKLSLHVWAEKSKPVREEALYRWMLGAPRCRPSCLNSRLPSRRLVVRVRQVATTARREPAARSPPSLTERGSAPQDQGPTKAPVTHPTIEDRLGGDLPAVGTSILLALGILLVDYGLEGILDIFVIHHWGAFGAIWCMAMVRAWICEMHGTAAWIMLRASSHFFLLV
jgi:hypothetical protein